MKSILFVSAQDDIDEFLDVNFYQSYEPIVLTPDATVSMPGPQSPVQLLVVSGYSVAQAMKKIPLLAEILASLPPKLPRLYLLPETDPSLSLVPLKGEERFFYLRGPLSPRGLKNAVDQILALKPRALRVSIEPNLGINAIFKIHSRTHGVRNFHKDVLEISPTGFSFHWSLSDPLIYPGELLDNLELRNPTRTFLYACARVRHLTPIREQGGLQGMRVGAEFVDPSAVGPDGVEVRGQAFLSDPVVIRTVLVDAVERKTLVLIRGEQPGWELQGVMMVCDTENHELQASFLSSEFPDELDALDIVTCQFVRDNAQLQFWSVLLRVDRENETIRLRFPKRLDKLWARTTLRYEFEPDNAPTLEIFTPITPESPIVRNIINLSPQGLCVEIEPLNDMLLRGMKIERMSLKLQPNLSVDLQGEVRYLSPRGSRQHPSNGTCGIQFRQLASEDHHALVDYLISKNYPRVCDATPEDEKDIWEFLQYADFFTPAKQDVLLGTPDAVQHTQGRMLHADPSFSRKLLFKDEGRIFGTVSLQQICQRTWIVHHLCAVRHRTEFVPKSLLLFLGEYISKTPEIDYIKMMWRPNNSWSNKMFGKLVHRLHDGEQSVVKVYSFLFHKAQSLPPPSEEVRQWKIRPIAPDEITELESYFINQEEYFLMKSEDLFRGGLNFEGINKKYQSLGLFRERAVFVAFEDGHLAGFSLAERSSPGLNLSNLLNTFQVHLCFPGSAGADSLKEALIRHTLQYYHDHGQAKAVAFSEETDLSVFEKLGFVKKKEYVSWTFDHNIANIYNLYCYYIFRIYERIEARRQELRARARP